MQKLTVKQKRFVEAYSGNAAEAARLAGYSPKTARFIGIENLSKPNIQVAIASRENKELHPLITSRTARQQLMVDLMASKKTSEQGKLKLFEMLCRSNADFVERKEISGPNGAPIAPPTMIVIKAG